MAIPKKMHAVQLMGHGGFDQLQYCEDVPVPQPAANEVLVRVAAAGINNTDVNTRIGWYSKNVSGETNQGGADGFAQEDVNEDGSWSGEPLKFPRIQGADICGHIVAVGDAADSDRIGERVLVRSMVRSYNDYRPFEFSTVGSECDGGFAQYCVAPAKETYAVRCDWSDIELASIPCAYSTAEGMLDRAAVNGADRVLILGASGGVGSAAVQLAKRRGAQVVAVSGENKAQQVKAIGADEVIYRDQCLLTALGKESVSVVIDVVVGDDWPLLLELLKRGGRYAVAGAIAGPLVELDVRTLYLKDLFFYGCTFQPDHIFTNLVQYIERGEIKPLVSNTYPLREIVQAQKDFLSKKYFGKLVLIPS